MIPAALQETVDARIKPSIDELQSGVTLAIS
jgi:hypothetical protein